MPEISAKSFTVSVAMCYCWKRHHFYAVIYFFCCFCLCIHGFYIQDGSNNSNPPSDSFPETKFLSSTKNDNYYQIWEMAKGMRRRIDGARRLLGGPGSWPPHCTSKCGGCMPCKPVHVAVPPGTRLTTEYYPEAWRCKCGNKLYMP